MSHELKGEQRRLARHALGLPNVQRRSYRNRFYAAIGSSAAREWDALVVGGLALSEEIEGRQTFYELTRAGAEASLDRGETLDLEDFPHG